MNDLLDVISQHPIPAGLIIGCLLGSFLNVVIHRVPLMLERSLKQAARQLCAEFKLESTEAGTQTQAVESEGVYNVLTPASACPGCGRALTWKENIPLISYLWLRGRCGGCKRQISIQYPLVEALSGLVVAAVMFEHGFSWTSVAFAVFLLTLIALAIIDLKTMYLPDTMTLPLLWLGLCLGQLGLLSASPQDSFWGAVAGYASLWAIAKTHGWIRGLDSMGEGDMKLLAAIGAWLGCSSLLPVLLIASSLFLLFAIARNVLAKAGPMGQHPFGPALALAAGAALFINP